ncbi:MAG: hypothetical protein CMI02_18080 [Oceanospirillaceae bacterium]|nr:hypothetical protein [Oceanospirillaceae bacterium]MBT13935.1 hypothetical protein [Oceanospirillaceae bacterium]
MNDDITGPPGMDARRADSDRDVARARGQKNRENEGERSRKRKAGGGPAGQGISSPGRHSALQI